MASIRVENFGGMAPRQSVRLLPQNFAQLAQNTKLFSGELRGWAVPKLIQDFSGDAGDVRTVYRLPAETPHPEQWLRFASKDVDVVRAPLVNDIHDRVYWTGEQTYAQYTTRNRITAGDPPLRLGVPRPATEPTVTVTPSGGIADPVTRFYVYTFVSAYGEEGQPSPVGEGTGPSDDTWDLSGMDTTVPDAAERNITHKNIYRTVVGESTTAFFFVEQIPLAQATYTDAKLDTEVALNETIESTTWAVPPDGLIGLVATANGFLAGFVGRDLYFSEAYRPHAWPADYVLSSEFPIVGLGVFGNSIAVMTSSAPYVASGVAPEAISFTKMDTTEPCLAKKGIVSTPVGVFYPSDNGLVLVSPSGYDLVTRPLLTEDEWKNQYKPLELVATRYGTRYIAQNLTFAFMLDHNEPNSAIVHVDDLLSETGGAIEPVDNLLTDYYNGDVHIVANKQVYLWDPQDTSPLSYTWKSKEFEFAKPINMGAGVIQANAAIRFTEEFRQQLRDYNASCLSAGPLNTVNSMALNATRRNVPLPQGLVDPPKTPLGGSHLFVLADYSDVSGLFRLKIWAGTELVLDAQDITPDVQFRVPSGVKSRTWCFEVSSNTPCFSVAIAETGKELARV